MSSPLRSIRLGALLLSAFALTACASMNVSSFEERGTNLNQYRTYRFGPVDATSTGDPRLDNNPFFHDRVRADVEKHLTAKGFTKSKTARADLVVRYRASMTQEIDPPERRALYPGEWNPCAGADCRPYVYDAGTLWIDLVEPRSGKLVWRGWAEGSVDGVVDNQALMEARIDDAVRKILDRLPRRM